MGTACQASVLLNLPPLLQLLVQQLPLSQLQLLLLPQQLLLQLHLPQPLHPLQPQPPPPPPQPPRIVTRRLESCVRISSTTSPGSAAAPTPAPTSLTGAQCARGPTWHLVTPALQQTREVLVTVLVLISALTMCAQHQTVPVSSLSMVFATRQRPSSP